MDEAPTAGLSANRAPVGNYAAGGALESLEDGIGDADVPVGFGGSGAGQGAPDFLGAPDLGVEGRRSWDQDLDDCGTPEWSIDGSKGHYHHPASLCLVMWAQVVYMVSLVIIIPTAGSYAASLGNTSAIYFGFVIGISSIMNPVVARLWNSVIRATSLNTVLLINASINLVCSLMYVMADHFGGDALLLVSRCVLGLGSVQTANLKYLGCAVSTKRVTFAHFLTTAAISYGFAFGTLLAFLLSLFAGYCRLNQNTVPGWFTALLWLTYIPLHRLIFKEPDVQAATVGPESRIRLARQMRPRRRREPFRGLMPCFAAIFAIAVVKGAFEVMTMEITQNLWEWEVMTSALYLGVVMLIVAGTTLFAYKLEKRLGEGRIFLGGLVGAALLLPFYYIPVSFPSSHKMGSALGMVVYLVVSILAFSFLNFAQTIGFSLTTALPSPLWRSYFLSVASEVFTMGRGVGPILVGAIDNKRNMITVMAVSCAAAALVVAVAFFRGALDHQEHELGPARAEEEEDEEEPPEESIESWVRTVDAWLGQLSSKDASGRSGTAALDLEHFVGVGGGSPHAPLPGSKRGSPAASGRSTASAGEGSQASASSATSSTACLCGPAVIGASSCEEDACWEQAETGRRTPTAR